MCGIAGFVGRGECADLERMTRAIAHRGPDPDGHWIDEKTAVHLGHRRLSIVDLTGGGQPMWTADGMVGVVFNGEIYNHAELREQLKARGCVFQTDHSDTEVLLHGYREWGDEFVTRLNGMWAFAIYDRAAGRLLLSRDRFGKKPLYWFHEGGTFAFASELTALLAHPACPRSISPLALKKFFAYALVPAPRSILDRVWKLPAGHNLAFDLREQTPRLTKYWDFVLEPAAPAKSDDALAKELLALVEAAVKRRLMSDVPLGIFLSGGIDSSLVAALAARHVPAGSLRTFSIGFTEASFDELAWANKVAGLLGTNHQTEVLDLDTALDVLPQIFDKLDEPSRHAVRKRLKRLRYLAELVAPLYKERSVRRFLRALEPAQDALGHFMDLVVATSLAHEVVDGGDPRAWFNVGWLKAQQPAAVERCSKCLRGVVDAAPFWR